TIADNVGNTSAPVESGIAKVDTSAPAAPSLSFGSFTNATALGSTVYFRQGASGGFTVSAAGSDAESGVSSYGFADHGAGWSGTTTGGDHAYSFDASAAAPSGPESVTVTNNADLTSNGTTYTVVADTSAPVSSASCDGDVCSS